MKKIHELLKPFLSIIFGALLFLVYLNYLSANGTALAIGVIAVILSTYYLASGILSLVLGWKLPNALKKVFDIVTISAYPLFFFLMLVLVVADYARLLGPTGWTIALLGMIGSISLSGIYVVSKLVENKVLSRIALLTSAIFVLVLLANLLFNLDGSVNTLGGISLPILAIYILYTMMLIDSVGLSLDALKENKEE